MICMHDWRVDVPKEDERIGYEGENLVYRLRIHAPDLPPDWEYKLDLAFGGDEANFLLLTYENGVLWVDIRREYLLREGKVLAQIRADHGEQSKRSNRFWLNVERSLNAHETFKPSIPSAYEQLETRMRELTARAEAAADRAENAGGEGGGGINWGEVASVVLLDRVELDRIPTPRPANTLYLVKG